MVSGAKIFTQRQYSNGTADLLSLALQQQCFLLLECSELFTSALFIIIQFVLIKYRCTTIPSYVTIILLHHSPLGCLTCWKQINSVMFTVYFSYFYYSDLYSSCFHSTVFPHAESHIFAAATTQFAHRDQQFYVHVQVLPFTTVSCQTVVRDWHLSGCNAPPFHKARHIYMLPLRCSSAHADLLCASYQQPRQARMGNIPQQQLRRLTGFMQQHCK